HCPYCHGYELDEGHLGVLASGPLSLHQAVLVAEWAGADGVTYFTNGAHDPDDAERAELAARNVRVEPRLVRHVGGASPRVVVTLDGGAEVTVAGLFLAPISRPSELALALGCDLTETPFGAVVAADPMTRETSVPGVFACGDAANPMAAIALAVADGVRAGAGVHRSLVMGPAARPRAARSAVSGAR
ncbi:MAG: NAD(P)/FAD-dependent oxidoreductase, partial [Myxococcales bacterium]|nr:NAD(P)/FAD-dependent oxidoreductase [Myxococcales bacterium]